MGLFLYDNNDITSFLPRVLIGFTVECVLAVVWCTLVDLGIKYLLLFCDLFTLASLALIGFVNDFTFATAIIAWAL